MLFSPNIFYSTWWLKIPRKTFSYNSTFFHSSLSKATDALRFSCFLASCLFLFEQKNVSSFLKEQVVPWLNLRNGNFLLSFVRSWSMYSFTLINSRNTFYFPASSFVLKKNSNNLTFDLNFWGFILFSCSKIMSPSTKETEAALDSSNLMLGATK